MNRAGEVDLAEAPEAGPGPADAEPPAGPRRGGLRTILVIAGGTAAVQGMTLVTGIISARLLGVDGRGQIALVAAVSTLVARLTMAGSLPVAVSHLLAREGQTARDGLRPFVRRWAAWAVLPSAVAGVYLGWLLRDAGTVVQLGLAGCVAAMTYQTIAAGVIGGAIQGELASASRVVWGALQLQAPFFVVLTVAAVAGWVDDAVTVAVIMVGTGAVGCVLAARLLAPARCVPSTIDRREVRRVSTANYVNSVGTLNTIGIDRNLVGAWLGTAQLGLYSAGTAFATLSSVIGTAVSSLLLPRLSAHHDRPEEQRRLIATWLPLTAAIILVLVGCLELVVEPVIRVAFGTEFLPAVDVARWLLLADGLFGFRRLLVCVLQARGRGALASWIELALTVVMVAGIAVAASVGELHLVGVVLAGVGALSCLSLAVAVRVARPLAPPRHRAP